MKGHDKLLKELVYGLVEGASAKGNDGNEETGALRTFKKGAAVNRERRRSELRSSMFRRFSKLKPDHLKELAIKMNDNSDDSDDSLYPSENGSTVGVDPVELAAVSTPAQSPYSSAPSVSAREANQDATEQNARGRTKTASFSNTIFSPSNGVGRQNSKFTTSNPLNSRHGADSDDEDLDL
jgi:hypothetical protein